MREILDPLAHIPGVRLAALISIDGVPIASAVANRADMEGKSVTLDRDEDLNSYTALAAGWLAEVSRSVLPLAWDAPVRAVLCATQGTLVLHRATNAVVLAVLERGVPYEELRVPIEGAIARMNRFLRAPQPAPRAPIPSEAGADSASPERPQQVENRTEG